MQLTLLSHRCKHCGKFYSKWDESEEGTCPHCVATKPREWNDKTPIHRESESLS